MKKEIIFIYGPSGSGKSRIINEIVANGHISTIDHNLKSINYRELLKKLQSGVHIYHLLELDSFITTKQKLLAVEDIINILNIYDSSNNGLKFFIESNDVYLEFLLGKRSCVDLTIINSETYYN